MRRFALRLPSPARIDFSGGTPVCLSDVRTDSRVPFAERYDGSAEHNAIQLSYIERSHEATQQALSCALYRFGLERGDFILARPFAVLRDFPFKIGRLPEPAASPNDRNCHGRPRAPTPNKCDIVQKFVSPDHRHSAGTRRS